MIKEVVLGVVDKIKHPLRPRLELKTDSLSWSDLVQKKIVEASQKGLPPRFFHSTSSSRYDFNIREKSGYTLIFYDSYVNTNSEFGMNEAVVLDVSTEPRYAFGFPTEEPSEKLWVVSDLGQDLDEIGLAFHHFKNARLFDSRQDKESWRGLYPDADGLIESLEEDEAIFKSIRNIPVELQKERNNS